MQFNELIRNKVFYWYYLVPSVNRSRDLPLA